MTKERTEWVWPLLLALALALSPMQALAADPPADDGLCAHHQTHDENCGYQPAAAEVPCDKECADADGDGAIDHAAGCAYKPAAEAVPCGYECAPCAALEGEQDQTPADPPQVNTPQTYAGEDRSPTTYTYDLDVEGQYQGFTNDMQTDKFQSGDTVELHSTSESLIFVLSRSHPGVTFIIETGNSSDGGIYFEGSYTMDALVVRQGEGAITSGTVQSVTVETGTFEQNGGAVGEAVVQAGGRYIYNNGSITGGVTLADGALFENQSTGPLTVTINGRGVTVPRNGMANVAGTIQFTNGLDLSGDTQTWEVQVDAPGEEPGTLKWDGPKKELTVEGTVSINATDAYALRLPDDAAVTIGEGAELKLWSDIDHPAIFAGSFAGKGSLTIDCAAGGLLSAGGIHGIDSLGHMTLRGAGQYNVYGETAGIHAREGITLATSGVGNEVYGIDTDDAAPIVADLTGGDWRILLAIDGDGNPVDGDHIASALRLGANTRQRTVISGVGSDVRSHIYLYYEGGGHRGGASVDDYTITATAHEGGSISPAGKVTVREGKDKRFAITPDAGYTVSRVEVDGRDVGAVEQYTFEWVVERHTITAWFAPIGEEAPVQSGGPGEPEKDNPTTGR